MNKKVTAGVLGAVAAASIATNLLVEPEELLRSAEALDGSAKVEYTDRPSDYTVTVREEGELTGADAVRAWIIRLPVVVKAVFLLPLWALGALPVAIGASMLSALAPLWGQIVGFLLQAVVLLGVFCLIYKLVFPNKPLKTLLKRKNLAWLALGAVGVTGANLILGLLWSDWNLWRGVILAVVGVGVLALLWLRLCKKLPAPKPPLRETQLRLSYD